VVTISTVCVCVCDCSASSGSVFRQGVVVSDHHRPSVLWRPRQLLCQLPTVHCITTNRYVLYSHHHHHHQLTHFPTLLLADQCDLAWPERLINWTFARLLRQRLVHGSTLSVNTGRHTATVYRALTWRWKITRLKSWTRQVHRCL